MNRTALILSGSGRYADPWHPFAATTERLAGILAEEGFIVNVDGNVDERLAHLPENPPDLLVVNIGDPALNYPDDPQPAAEARARAGLLWYVREGLPILAMHTSVTSLRGIPDWPRIIGGIWRRGTSYHPDYGTAAIRIGPAHTEVNDKIQDFSVDDERYTDLDVEPDNTILATHEEGGRDHPIIWQRTYGPKGARVVLDALGHDTASYDSTEHVALLSHAVRWLTT
ncbi:ThuA domain-containing protein [Leifsonia shinshuensis]|uniref:ThuA domain-containing protein n=1 Tax=Leifsonia shinshuensis TaxID=150026 RepID=A0A7G6YAB6_9MICO|nr:ThuA domain-containing protein [Leifsonia shinshuensis]QNE35431.1 ThuA domain-containing protein [Leifsonia shinshuensis]